MAQRQRSGASRSTLHRAASPRSDSRLANDVAHLIWDDYQGLWERFFAITSRAPRRFAEADWEGMEADTRDRLRAYINQATDTAASVRVTCDDRLTSVPLWTGIKAVFSGLSANSAFPELAETFFNSITRKVFVTEGVNQRIEFVTSDLTALLPDRLVPGTTATISANGPTAIPEMIRNAFGELPWEDLARDVVIATRRLEVTIGPLDTIEYLPSVFYRGRGGYLIGRASSGSDEIPFCLAFVHDARVRLDAVLTTTEELSILFSFAHSYFHAIVDHPSSVVAFLTDLMPRKRLGELYTSLGYHKHGKTDLFRSLVEHLETFPDRFQIAEGVEGMVMSVFTLPGFDVVFKVIKDSFPPQKDVTRLDVKSAYEMVFNHDRVGRLVDVYEFEHLTFPKERFDPALLEHLREHCERDITIEPSTVIINHVYIERRVTPLDVFIRRADTEAVVLAVLDYGQAIKDLRSAGIFPGDMLLKNFGVTRQGRVVFYDYDEVKLLEECRFRAIPVAAHPDDEMSATPWFSTGPGDVFPEEFVNFLGLQPALREIFTSVHGDLFSPDGWVAAQASIAAGKPTPVYPYRPQSKVSP